MAIWCQHKKSVKQLFLRYNTLFLVHILLALLVWPTDQLDVSITLGVPASIGTLMLLENHVAHAEASANKVRVLYIFIFSWYTIIHIMGWKEIVLLYHSGNGKCFDVAITTKSYGSENSWTVGACTSARGYQNSQTYTESCCLDAGSYKLTCDDSYKDGWHGGFIEIQGKRYCEDFTSGHQQENNVDISYAGKHIFKK